MKIATLFLIAIVSISSFGFAQTVTIGNQTWTTKNLDVATFRNGDAIPQAKTNEEWKAAGENKQPAWCYYDNDVKNGPKYGKLYNWYAVKDARGLAPAGYHIPTDDEWIVLENSLGDDIGKKMKSSTGWNGDNSSGFSGLPGGFRSFNGNFNDVGFFGYWWSASEYFESAAWNRELWYHSPNLNRDSYYKEVGFSVRCVRD